MKARSQEAPIMDKFKKAIHKYFGLLFAFSILLAVLRILELSIIYLKGGFPYTNNSIIALLFYYDFIFISKIALIVFPFFFLFFLIKKKLSIIITKFFLSASILLYLILIQYFETSLLPLGAEFYGYSFKEIKTTVQASGGLEFIQLFSIILTLPISIFLNQIFNRTRIPIWLYVFFFIPGILFYLSVLPGRPESNDFQTESGYYLALNKLDFFTFKSINYFKEKKQGAGMISENASRNSIIKLNRPSSKDRDVLGNFFEEFPSTPNIVIIIVEGLGRAYSGPNAYAGSFTPYLDTLSKNSIYFDNFLSNQGRTFGVLPSVLASLPMIENGILTHKKSIPNHLSLISLLKKNGYYTSFFYGGDASFDNMENFLIQNKIDTIIQGKSFERKYRRMKGVGNKFSWGFMDQDLFKKSFDVVDKIENKPRLDIYLTLSTHDPFLINNQSYYLNKFHQILDSSKIAIVEKERSRQFEIPYSTFVAFDEALEYYINRYKKNKARFENTIFLITGDHRIPETPIASRLDRFHVPLVIYSPKLKKGSRIASISSQLDICPTLISFLRDNYKLNLPEEVHWMGSTLDTNKEFSCKKNILLMRNKNEIVDYVSKLKMYSNNELFNLYPLLDMELIPFGQRNEYSFNKIKKEFLNLKNKESFVIDKNKIANAQQMQFIK